MQAEGRGPKFVTTQRSNNNNGNRREGLGFVPLKYEKGEYEVRNTSRSVSNLDVDSYDHKALESV